MSSRSYSRLFLSLGAAAALFACGRDDAARAPIATNAAEADAAASGPPSAPPPQQGIPTDGGVPDGSPIPSVGSPDTLDVGSWNIEWFGSAQRGPFDDALQAARVREIVNAARIDVWGFQEVVDGASLKSVVRAVSGYDAIIASDDVVEGGAVSYSADEQKVAFGYDSRVVRVLGARVILAASSYDFAGRPPLEVRASYATQDGRDVPITFVVVHLKAGDDETSWARRQASIAALKRALDGRAESEAIFIIGDWNDELARSKVSGKGSPFAPLVDDKALYAFPTLNFQQRGVSTMVTARFANDQHVLTIAAAASYVEGSATAWRLDKIIDGYGDTTSDHYPVVSRYRP